MNPAPPVMSTRMRGVLTAEGSDLLVSLTADWLLHRSRTTGRDDEPVSPSRLRLGLAVVRGRSMEPTLHDGDRVVVLWGGRPLVGRLAVVRLPETATGPRPVGVKRVTGSAPGEPGSWWVERDNPSAGVDSWVFGAIAPSDVLGLVLMRVPRASCTLAATFSRRMRRR